MKLDEKIKNEIVNKIKSSFAVKNIFLYGSFAKETANENSDIDLTVILDKKGFTDNFEERINNKTEIRKALGNLNKQLIFDISVFTNDDWTKLLSMDGFYKKEIYENGIRLL